MEYQKLAEEVQHIKNVFTQYLTLKSSVYIQDLQCDMGTKILTNV